MLAFQEISCAWENLFFLLYFQFFKSEVEGFLISHFSILLLVFFRNIYISSSSLFDIIRFFFWGFFC